MEFDFEKLFKYLAVENTLLVLGISSLFISIYNNYITGMKLGFLFILYGAIFRFYRINIVSGILHNYKNKPKYLKKVLQWSPMKNDYVKLPTYVVPFRESWYIEAIDFIICSIILVSFVYFFLIII